MFTLQSRTGPAAFESIGSNGITADDYAWVSFHPTEPMTFADITMLKTDFTYTTGESHGGSLRWQVRVDANDSGAYENTDPAVLIYYGDAPNWTGTAGSGANMIGWSDLRYDTGQFVGGTFYDSYTNALALAGSHEVLSVSLVVDSGWQNVPDGDQILTISDTTVNDSVYDFQSSETTDWARTCDLPPATIDVTKTDNVENGAINELPVQASLTDDGNLFRVVDCKYQYILSIPSLKGTGTYRVQMFINGTEVPTPDSAGGKVKFDLK